MIMCICKKVNNRRNTNENIYGSILAVSNRKLCTRPFEEQIRRVCSYHPRALILREKDLPEEEYYLLAKKVMEICRDYKVSCIPHTYVDAARRLESQSIHLPLFLLEKYQGKLDDFTVIGTSVHSVEEAEKAQGLGASYITAGHIYSTDCKKGLPPRGLKFLSEVCGAVSIPVYAIGGIRLDGEQIHEVMECGAAGGCVMSEMMKI